MAESCRITPCVKNLETGEIEESKLYLGLQKLMSYVGKGERSQFLPLYQRTLAPDFKKDMALSGAIFDEYGEISLYDYWLKFDNGTVVPEDVLIQFLNESNFFSRESTSVEFTDKQKLIKQVAKFNSDPAWNRGYIAIIDGSGSLRPEDPIKAHIEPVTDENKHLRDSYELLNKNGTFIRNSLKHAGHDERAYDRLEAKFTNGYTDFSRISEMFDGLVSIIEQSKNKSIKNIPEDFGAFVVDLMSESPLVIRAKNILMNNQAYLSVFDDPNAAKVIFGNNVADLLSEALGLIISGKVKDITNQAITERIKKSINSVLSKIDSDGVITTSAKKKSLKNVKLSHTQNKDIFDHFFNITLKRQLIYQKRKKELGLTEEDDTGESILTEQEDLLKNLDIAANHDWSNDYVIRAADGTVIDIKTKDDFRIMSAIKLIGVAIKDTERIQNVVKELRTSIENGTYKGSINSACAKVRAIMDYLESYQQIFDNFSNLLNEAFNDESLNSYPEIETIRENLRQQAGELQKNLQEIKNEVLPDNKNYDLKTDKRPLAVYVFLKGLEDFIPEGVGYAVGTGINGEVMTLEELLMYSDRDIVGISAWLNSMANTSDEIARVYDHIVKRQKDEARQECIAIQREIKASGEKLEKGGFSARNHKWMYQHNPDGTLKLDSFGRPMYIKDYDMEAAVKAVRKKKQELYSKYKGLSHEDKELQIKKDLNEWMAERFEYRHNETFPKKEYFPNKEYLALSPVQKEFFDTFMRLKRKLDNYLPMNTDDSSTAIIVRKSGLQKLLTLSKDYTLTNSIKDWFKNTFNRTATDDEYGVASAMVDFSGKEIKRLPIYYTRIDPNKNLNNYSFNSVANLCLYAHTASNYKAMAKVVETLELGKTILEQRRTHKRNVFGQPLVRNIRNGHKTIQEYVYCDQKSTSFSKRLENFMDMQVYGKLHTGSKYSKYSSFFSRAIGTFTTAINVFVGLTNVIQGLGQINIEMFAGEHFSVGDLLKAKKFYWQHILSVIAETGKLNKSSILSLLSEDFNVMQDFDTKIKDVNQYEKNRFYRMGALANIYMLNHIGEHYMQHLTFLALANRTKIYTSDGKAVSLLDAYETKQMDGVEGASELTLKSYTNNKGQTSRVYYTVEGNPIVSIEELKRRQQDMAQKGKKVDINSKLLLWNENEISELEFKGKFSRKSAKLNQDMHGIYNEDDKNQLQQKAYGSLFMMYRKHIVPNFMKRWKGEWYDYDLDTTTSGYQRLFFDKLFSKQKNKMGKEKWAMLVWNQKDRANFMRNIGQLSNWVLINLAITLMEGLGDDDDEEKLWYSIILVSLYRGKTENAQFEPLALASRHSIINEWWRLAEQPVVGFSIFERISNLIELFDPESWTHVMKSGPYKGETKATKIIKQALPGFNQIRMTQKPPLEYFRNDVGQEWFTGWMFDED